MDLSQNCLTDEQRDAQFRRAFEQLNTLIDWKDIDREFPRAEQAVYVTSVVVWMLLYQRMCPDKSLEVVVKNILEVAPHLMLPNSKRVIEGSLSSNPSGYSRARTACKLNAVQKITQTVSDSLISNTAPSLNGRRVVVIDGTTLTLAPCPKLRRDFPPARNQFGPTAFPLALLLMGFELESGVALQPVLGAMYGDNAVSETALVSDIVKQLPTEYVIMADAAFGIFDVAWQLRRCQRNFLLRLTVERFESHRRQATLVSHRDHVKTYQLKWRPSSKERKTHTDLPPDAQIEVFLHEIQLSKTEKLYLVTTLTDDGAELTKLYQKRYDAEIDIRNFKVVLNAEATRVQSTEMFQKELWTSVLSYNLVCQFRREAAQQAKLRSRQLSFKRVLSTFEIFLLSHLFKSPTEARLAFDRALTYAMKDKLPNRPNRHYDREAYQRRPKSAQFQKRAVPKDST